MSVLDLGSKESYGMGNDPIVIRKYIAGIMGGRVLDVDGFSLDEIKAGHIIIRKVTDGEKDVYKPLNVTGGNYVSLPSGHEYAGVAVATVDASEPFVGIMYNGEVNDVASPYPITATLKAALKTALPTLTFQHD